MSTLEKMGIQQWRLRQPIDSAGSNKHLVTQEANSEINSEAETLVQNELAKSVKPAADISDSANQAPLDKIAHDQLDWPEMEKLLIAGTRCASCCAQNSLLGSGARTADWLFVSDSPNSKEVAAKTFFDGRAGKLFEAMLRAIGLERENVYCTSIFKCAPTEDLSSSPQCGDWVHQQITLIKPTVIVVFGEFAAQTLLKSNEPLSLMRENSPIYRRSGAKVIATHRPREMLEECSLKAQVWIDLKKAMQL